MNRAQRRAAKFKHAARYDAFAPLRTIERANWAANPLPAERIDEIAMLALSALESITTGHGTDDHVAGIALAVNMTSSLIRQGIGVEATEIVERAQTALLSADARCFKTGKWGFTGQELTAIRDLLDVHERLIAASSQLEIRRALEDIRERTARGEVLPTMRGTHD